MRVTPWGGRQVLDVMLRSAQGSGDAQGDTTYGRGRLDVYRAYQLALAERHCAGRVVSTLEGGYDLAALGRSAAAHVWALMTPHS